MIKVVEFFSLNWIGDFWWQPEYTFYFWPSRSTRLNFIQFSNFIHPSWPRCNSVNTMVLVSYGNPVYVALIWRKIGLFLKKKNITFASAVYLNKCLKKVKYLFQSTCSHIFNPFIWKYSKEMLTGFLQIFF